MSLPHTEILNHITEQYAQATTGWYSALFPIASHLFAMLAIIELAWCGIWWAIEKNELSSIWVELLKKMMVIGFFYTVMLNAQQWIPAVIKSFMVAGRSASHISQLDPSSLFDQGISIASSVFIPLEKAGFLSLNVLAGWIIGFFIAFFILLCFAVIAGLLVVTLVESYIVVGAGILMLGFSGSRWTTQYATNYLTYAMSVGAKLFVLYLVVGIGSNLASTWGNLMVTGGLTNLTPFFEVLGGALVFAFIAMAIPSKASSLISGASHSTIGALAATAGAASVVASTPAKMAFGSASALKETIQQGQAISSNHQQRGDSPIRAAVKGVMGSAANLGVSAVGSATGHYRNTSQAMKDKTRAIHEKHAVHMETSSLAEKSPLSSAQSHFSSPPETPLTQPNGPASAGSASTTSVTVTDVMKETSVTTAQTSSSSPNSAEGKSS